MALAKLSEAEMMLLPINLYQGTVGHHCGPVFALCFICMRDLA